MASPCEMPAGVRGFISFHFPRQRKISQAPTALISHPKDISLPIPPFLLYNHFKKQEFDGEIWLDTKWIFFDVGSTLVDETETTFGCFAPAIHLLVTYLNEINPLRDL